MEYVHVLVYLHVLSLADITIGFAMSNCTVSESVGDAMLTVTAQGDFPSVGLQSRLTVPVEVSVLVRTEDITAEGGLFSYEFCVYIILQKHSSVYLT